MKIVKYVFLLLFLIVIAATVFIATQEGKYDIKKERIIKVPKAVLYNYITDYRNWENVGILTSTDTATVYSYSENSAVEGAFMTWKKDDSTGKIQTMKLVENDSIVQNAVIDNLTSEISWRFKDTLASNTKMSVRLKGELSFTEKAYALLKGGVEEKIESSLEKGLDNLNTFLVHELSVYNVEVKGLVIKTGAFYLGHSTTVKISDVSKKAAEILPKLTSFTKANKIATNGAPFILYKSFNRPTGTASITICIPIKEEIFTASGSEIEGGELTSFTALKTTLKGDYSHLSKAWDAANRHIAAKALEENTTGHYVEVFTKGMRTTKKPSEWITDVYIPIGRPIAVLVTEPVSMPPTAPVTPSTRPAAIKPAGATTRPATGSAAATGTVKPVTRKPATPTVNRPAATPPATTPR